MASQTLTAGVAATKTNSMSSTFIGTDCMIKFYAIKAMVRQESGQTEVMLEPEKGSLTFFGSGEKTIWIRNTADAARIIREYAEWYSLCNMREVSM